MSLTAVMGVTRCKWRVEGAAAADASTADDRCAVAGRDIAVQAAAKHQGRSHHSSA